MITVVSVCSDLSQTTDLTNSTVSRGWRMVKIKCQWRGFGTKLIETYKFLKESPDVDRFIFCDAHDVIALGTPAEFESKLYDPDKILVSCERGCWPDDDLRKYYEPIFDHGFNFVNSGLYYAPASVFIDLMERFMPEYAEDDQRWMTKMYLFESDQIVRDTEQKVFNSHSFIKDGEYGYENNRVQILGNEPCFIHFNGRTFDEKFNELIKL